MAGACVSLCCDRLCYAMLQCWCWGRGLAWRSVSKKMKRLRIIFGWGVCWGVGVGGGLVGVGLGLLRFAGGVNVAWRKYCILVKKLGNDVGCES